MVAYRQPRPVMGPGSETAGIGTGTGRGRPLNLGAEGRCTTASAGPPGTHPDDPLGVPAAGVTSARRSQAARRGPLSGRSESWVVNKCRHRALRRA